MSIPFSERPGRHERHYRRQLGNPLFTSLALQGDDETLLEVQRRDHEELIAFLTELRETVQQAVELRANEGSEVILAIKERLDRLYETSCGLAEDHAANQAAIAQLIEVIMRNVERGALGDAQALDELAQERAARAAHFELLRWPLVADLLHPHSSIAPDQLAATLLSSDEAELAAALQLFDIDQLSELHTDAERCLARCAGGYVNAAQRLAQIVARMGELAGATPLN